MTTRAENALWALTEKEKQTLRLMVRGHDAKSIARSLGLSIHTINERLRDARRKMAVSSSREAARLLLEAEGGGATTPNPDFVGDAEIGADAASGEAERAMAPTIGVGPAHRRPRSFIGVPLMTLALGILALTALTQVVSTPAQAPTELPAGADAAVVDTARQFLVLLDQRRWEDSYRATGAPFRKLNTAKVWAEVSQKVRAPLGAAESRTVLSQQDLPAPPHGYQVVKFRTRFPTKPDAVETVSLDREQGGWRVVGVTIE